MKNLKFFNYLITIILSLAATLAAIYTWLPLLLTIYSFRNPAPVSGFETPTRVVGVNYPTTLVIWFVIILVVLLLILLLMARRRKASSGFFWINGISIAIILSHIIIWAWWGNPVLFWNSFWG